MKSMSIRAGLLAAALLTAPGALAQPVLHLGDEPAVTRPHAIAARGGQLRYATTAGRLAIRADESDEPRGHMFYVAYQAQAKQKPRPLMFVWGGGPGGDSIALQHEFMGPRLIQGDVLADNPDTLLSEVDLVFVDAMGTGFSRPAKPEYAAQFYTMSGDAAAMSEFIRSYLALRGETRRPIYVAGQSLGTWRAASVGEILAKAGYDLRGIVIISGQVPGAEISFPFDDAMYIPTRTEAAIFHSKLDADLMRDPDRTRAEVEAWTRDAYWPALERKATLTVAEREAIARNLARYTGVDERLIDRQTLTMTTGVYRETLIGKDRASVLAVSDYTVKGPRVHSWALRATMGDFFRRELGYATSLTYTASANPIERSFLPPTAEKPHQPTDFAWDEPEMTREELKRLQDGYAPPNAPPWLQNALRANPRTRVFVAAGRYDPMVSCLGNRMMIERLTPELKGRYDNHCYWGGHSIYRDRPQTRVSLTEDLKRFVAAGGPDQ